MDVFVYDERLNAIAVVDSYRSFIWANRYWESGDCELYLPASAENFELLKINRFIGIAEDDTMLCIIKKVELDTSYENGDYIIVTGLDCKSWLDQRIVWSTMNADGKAELFIRQMVDKSIGSGASSDRQIKNNGVMLVELGNSQGFTEALTEQVSYKNVGEKVRDYCRKFGWGYRLKHVGNKLKFELYAGQDKRDSVVFSDQYENLISTAYIEDETKQGNVAVTAGEGEGSERSKTISGSGTSVDRYELFVDARDISRLMTYEELAGTYSGGTIVPHGDLYDYVLAQLDLQIIDEGHKAWLQANYTGTVEFIAGVEYYRMQNIPIAVMETNTPDSVTTVILYDIIYTAYLLTRGYNRLAEYGKVTSFTGAVEPRSTFKYREDFNLGDIVTIANQYGITLHARITSVIEVEDDNGYSLEPKFEYIDMDMANYVTFLQSSEGSTLLNEEGLGIITENSRNVSTQRVTGIKISQLPEETEVGESHFMPLATDSETVKVSYSTLLNQINHDVGVDDYEALENKPKIEGITLTGDKSFEDLNLEKLTNTEIEEILQ